MECCFGLISDGLAGADMSMDQQDNWIRECGGKNFVLVNETSNSERPLAEKIWILCASSTKVRWIPQEVRLLAQTRPF